MQGELIPMLYIAVHYCSYKCVVLPEVTRVTIFKHNNRGKILFDPVNADLLARNCCTLVEHQTQI
jgi:hypothetical protein